MSGKAPKLCRHKGTGRAYATDPRSGREVYFGSWGSPEAAEAYARWLREFQGAVADTGGRPVGPGLDVGQLIDAYLAHAESYYRKHGRPTSEYATVADALAPVYDLYPTLPAADFGPAQLKAVRARYLEKGWARGYVNKQVGRLRRVWRWAVEQSLVPPVTLTGLAAVAPLRRGRPVAQGAAPPREEEPVRPVPWGVVEAVLPHCKPRLRALVLVHFHGCMRAEEAVLMRPRDIDQAAAPGLWLYVPHTHKTEHLDLARDRHAWLGPRAQAALAPLLAQARKPGDWLFRSKGRGPHSKYFGHLTVSGYRQALRDATDRANAERAAKRLPPLPYFFPLQIRHAALTLARQRLGLEAAQAAGGHAEADTAQIYAQRLDELAQRVAAELG